MTLNTFAFGCKMNTRIIFVRHSTTTWRDRPSVVSEITALVHQLPVCHATQEAPTTAPPMCLFYFPNGMFNACVRICEFWVP